MNLETSVCRDPLSEQYDCSRAHPENRDKNFTDLIVLYGEERDFLRSHGFEILFHPSVESVGVNLSEKVLPDYHVGLGKYSDFGGEGELRVQQSPYCHLTHMTHWHPRCSPQDKLARQVEIDILETSKTLKEQGGKIPLFVTDTSWMPIIKILESTYGTFERYKVAEVRR